MITFKNILVPTDFGDPAKRAREMAIAIARKFDSKVTLFHAYYLPSSPYAQGFALPMEEIAKMAEDAMQKELGEAQRDYPGIAMVVRAASPADGIIAAARELPADLIVMGTQGRRGVSRFILGSVAENIVRLASVPVLTVSAKAEA